MYDHYSASTYSSSAYPSDPTSEIPSIALHIELIGGVPSVSVSFGGLIDTRAATAIVNWVRGEVKGLPFPYMSGKDVFRHKLIGQLKAWVSRKQLVWDPFMGWKPGSMTREQCWDMLKALDSCTLTTYDALNYYIPIGLTLNDIRYDLLIKPMDTKNKDRLTEEHQLLMSRLVAIEEALSYL